MTLRLYFRLFLPEGGSVKDSLDQIKIRCVSTHNGTVSSNFRGIRFGSSSFQGIRVDLVSIAYQFIIIFQYEFYLVTRNLFRQYFKSVFYRN